ncbi:MAG: metallophosphoesterase [Bacteroidetes bacterium]|nr:MAG: metallophosphoesterase [Bacteroidota bacterium]REK08152.1 MAG: metallophosphoesterase [Bacteroidota bacterium]REK32357.1 MAG: metallophosphoesterase [Bacteroidota bacterium]REK49591.1 MAG: metallophosphoesterase [Bacteroidota bacterium]
MTLRILLIILLLLLIDLYVFNGLKSLIQGSAISIKRFVTILFWSLTVISVMSIMSGQIIDWRTWPKMFRTFLFASIVILYLSKVFVLVFLMLDDLVRGGRYLVNLLSALFEDKKEGVFQSPSISRHDFLVRLGFIVGAVPFISMIYGMTGGAYNYKVRKVKLRLVGLPDTFRNMKLVQISDLHLGSFMSVDPLKKAVELINSQKPDLVLFTGDLVNDRAAEVLPYKDVLSEISARHGVYSVLGNHDYGDYYRWNSEEEKISNFENLKQLQKEMGWKLLLNSNDTIERDGSRLALIGVENWSARMNFQRYGNLDKAVDGLSRADVNILLSHDPSHWDAEVNSKYSFIDLTLSGHTHGFQFGVEVPGFRWSPVQYVYQRWADLYKTGKQYLYVNRGLGFIGYPGRVGILPEITVIELVNS